MGAPLIQRAKGLFLLLLLLMIAAPLRVTPELTDPDDEFNCVMASSVGRMRPRADIVIHAGEPLRLACQLKNQPPTQLNFSRGDEPVDTEFLTYNGSWLQLDVPRHPESISIYYCSRRMPNGTVFNVCMRSVVAAVPPRPVDDFACVSDNWMNLTCKWTDSPGLLTTNYTLTYRLSGRAARNSIYACPNYTKTDNKPRVHTCTWDQSTHPHYRRAYEIFNFNLLSVNNLGSLVQNYTFNHYAHVKPFAPENFAVARKTVDSANLTWQIPSPMELFPPGIDQRVTYCSEHFPDSWTDVDAPYADKNTNQSFLLAGLEYANTRYDIRLKLKSARATTPDLWSNFASLTVRTLSKPPDRPPLVDPGCFETKPTMLWRTVYVYWRKIEPYEENGENFTYRVAEAETDSGAVSVFPKTSAKNHIVLDRLPLEKLTLKIVSSNADGDSKSAAVLVIPAQEDILPEPAQFTKIAYKNGPIGLSWLHPRGLKVDNYTLFWCDDKRDRPYQCEGKLEWKTLSGTERAYNVTLDGEKTYQFGISANGRNSTSGITWATCTIIPDNIVNKMRNVWINRVGSNYIEVDWKLECADNNGIVQGYLVAYCPIVSVHNTTCRNGVSMNITVQTSSVGSHCNISGLIPHTTYAITVKILTKYGEGLPSDRLYNTTHEGTPTPPVDVRVSNLGYSKMTVSWQKPVSMNGVLKEYRLTYVDDYRNEKMQKLGRTENYTEISLENLNGFTNYTVTIVACTVFCSKPSDPVIVRTAIGPSGMIDGIRTNVNSKRTVLLKWDPPVVAGGMIDYYEIEAVEVLVAENRTNLYNTTINKFVIPFVICHSPEIVTNKYRVRAVNLDKADDHGAAVFTDSRSVKISRRPAGEENTIVYTGPWSDEGSTVCLDSKKSDSVMIIGISVGVFVSLLFFGYVGKKLYICVQRMRNIKPCMPPGLDVEKEKDIKPHLGIWGTSNKDSDKLSKPPSDAEFLLLTKDMKGMDNCNNSNCSANTESTAFSNSNHLSGNAKDGLEPMDGSLSANSSLRLRNISAGSRPGSINLSEPWNQADGMASYSAVGLWDHNDFAKEDLSPPATNKGYVSVGTFGNPFNNNNEKKVPLINICDNQVPPDYTPGYVVTGIDPMPVKSNGYVSVTDQMVKNRHQNPMLAFQEPDPPYVQLSETKHPANNSVITPAYIKNSELDAFHQKLPKQTNTLNDISLLDSAEVMDDSVSPTYCKFGVNANDPHLFDFQQADNIHSGYQTDLNHDNENNMFMMEKPAQMSPPMGTSHYVPHNPGVNRL